MIYFYRNYDAELYACTHRFGEKMNIESLRQAMTDSSFLNQIHKQRSEAGIERWKDFELLEKLSIFKVLRQLIKQLWRLLIMKN